MNDTISDVQRRAILCAFLDLKGALQAHEQGDNLAHDWKAHKLTMEELVEAFPWLEKEESA